MTFQTRTIAKRPGTYMDTGETGVHVNRITLRAEPWDEPELKPEHQRPAPSKLEAVFSAKSGGHDGTPASQYRNLRLSAH